MSGMFKDIPSTVTQARDIAKKDWKFISFIIVGGFLVLGGLVWYMFDGQRRAEEQRVEEIHKFVQEAIVPLKAQVDSLTAIIKETHPEEGWHLKPVEIDTAKIYEQKAL